jgi:hypothetical protein
VGAQPAEVVGDQALPLLEQGGQLSDAQVAVGELAQDAPAQRVGGEVEERWHGTVHQTTLMDMTCRGA